MREVVKLPLKFDSERLLQVRWTPLSRPLSGFSKVEPLSHRDVESRRLRPVACGIGVEGETDLLYVLVFGV